MTETPTERRLRELAEIEREWNQVAAAAIDKGRQAIALLRQWRASVGGDEYIDRSTLIDETVALLAACQEDEG